jgi:hypothetical protein
MQPQPDVFHPVFQRRQHLLGLALAFAVHDRVVHIPFEGQTRILPGQPHVEGVVEKQISQHGRNRGPLRGSPVALLQGPVRQRQRRLKPPLDIQHHPTVVGVCLDRFEYEIPGSLSKNF